MIEGKLIRSTLVEFFQEISFYIEQEEFCDNGKKLLISLSRIKNGYCIKKKRDYIQKLLVIGKLDFQNAITIK